MAERTLEGPKLQALRAVAFSLRTDRATAEASRALAGAGIEHLLLKGPAVKRLLYDPGELRPYTDVDLLVREDDLDSAGAVLQGLSYERPLQGEEDLVAGWQEYHHVWLRPSDRACIELHWRFRSLRARPSEVWECFRRDAGTLVVGGATATVLAPPRLALLMALHCAAHGPADPKPRADLERAVARLGREVWREAAENARELQALPAFVQGLRGIPAGEALAGELGLQAAFDLDTSLNTAPHPLRLGVAVLEQAARVGSWSGRVGLLMRSLFPSPAFMRYNGPPLARRGRAGLALAYGLRLRALAGKAMPIWRYWRAARRAARASRS